MKSNLSSAAYYDEEQSQHSRRETLSPSPSRTGVQLPLSSPISTGQPSPSHSTDRLSVSGAVLGKD